MTQSCGCWAGVDVGAKKGFDLAVIARKGLVAGPTRITRFRDVVEWLREYRPCVVAVDSPRTAAAQGELSRSGERELVRAKVCGIRYTPNEDALKQNSTYYAWIINGFDLYAALSDAARSTGWNVIECFPTASWSRLGGPRGDLSRARWSREVLDRLEIDNLPRRMNQDARDAIGAAITARLHDDRDTDTFGDIVVPTGPP